MVRGHPLRCARVKTLPLSDSLGDCSERLVLELNVFADWEVGTGEQCRIGGVLPTDPEIALG